MSSSSVNQPAPGSGAAATTWAPEPFDPPLLAGHGGMAAKWLGPVISLAIFGAVLWQLRTMHIAQVVAMVPRAPMFWLVFAIFYLATPAADFLIFRRLWALPAAGFGALTRKFVGNEILMGYIGELHFYSWARSRMRMVAAPFGAVKDVAILSAVAGNVVTLAVLAAAYPFLGVLHLGLAPGTILMAVGITLGTSLLLLAFRGRLLTLATRDLLFVVGVQFARVIATSLLPALLWHLALPQVAIGWWLLLAAVRLLLSRLPLLPNKDLVFAGVAVVLVGTNVAIGDLMTMMASLILATHLLTGAGLVLAEFALGGRRLTAPMRIVDVCAFYAPEGGGVRTYIERKLKAAPAAGHELIVLAPGRTSRVEQRGPMARIEWLASPRFPLDRRYGYFADAAALHAALDRLAPDVVEVSSPWRSASMVADWRGDARRVLVMHADPLSAYAYRWFGGVADRATIDRGFGWFWRHLRRLDTRYDAVVSASASLSQRLTEGGLRRVITNPMGVDPGIFSPGLRDAGLRARLLERCALQESATLLLAVGRHAPEKRWPMVIDAAMAAGARRAVGLVLVGDGRARARIMRQTGANPHVCLLSPIRDRTALATLMASADALIHGCEAETFCIVAAEAHASGLPLIAPDSGGAADQAVAHGGLTYRAGSSASAARAITRFVDHPQRPTGAVRTMDAHFDELFALYGWLDQPAARAA